MAPKQIWPLVGAEIHGCRTLVVFYKNGTSIMGYFPKTTPLPMIMNNKWLFIPVPKTELANRIVILDGSMIDRIETALGWLSPA